MRQRNALIGLLPEFFYRHHGTVKDITTMVRHNHQHPRPPADGSLTCLTVDVLFRNRALFGESGPFLTEVFPRYRSLAAELRDFLLDRGIAVNAPQSTISVTIAPYPEAGSPRGDALPKLHRPSRGTLTPPVKKLADQSKYYRRLAERYSVDYGLITNNGTVIGPDGGILATAWAVAQVLDRPLSVVELGTGAAATATALLGMGKLARYRGNDFSPELGTFFESFVRPRLDSARVHSQMVVDSCYRFPLHDGECDLLIVGIYYEGQPDLVLRRGHAMASCVKSTGVLVVQSSKPESPFVTDLLKDTDTVHSLWPWYRDEFCLKRIFRRVEAKVVEGETMLIASDDADLIESVLELLGPSPLNDAGMEGAK